LLPLVTLLLWRIFLLAVTDKQYLYIRLGRGVGLSLLPDKYKYTMTFHAQIMGSYDMYD